jgi:hypothetical protein
VTNSTLAATNSYLLRSSYPSPSPFPERQNQSALAVPEAVEEDPCVADAAVHEELPEAEVASLPVVDAEVVVSREVVVVVVSLPEEGEVLEVGFHADEVKRVPKARCLVCVDLCY